MTQMTSEVLVTEPSTTPYVIPLISLKWISDVFSLVKRYEHLSESHTRNEGARMNTAVFGMKAELCAMLLVDTTLFIVL